MLCKFSITKEQQFEIRYIFDKYKDKIENAPEHPGGFNKKCMKKTCYHHKGTCIIDKDKFLTDLYEYVRLEEWGRIKKTMIGWEKMLEHDFQNYQNNVEYEAEQKIKYDRDVREAFYIWKRGQSFKYGSMDVDDEGLPPYEHFEKWLSDKVFVFRDQCFYGKESWGVFNT